MINAMRKLDEAIKNYNPITGVGANELLKALVHYQKKSREVDNALEKVGIILGGRK